MNLFHLQRRTDIAQLDMTTSANATPGKSPDELNLLTDYSAMQIALGKRFFSRPNAVLSAIAMDPKGPQAQRVLARLTGFSAASQSPLRTAGSVSYSKCRQPRPSPSERNAQSRRHRSCHQ